MGWLHSMGTHLMPLHCTLRNVKMRRFMLCLFYHNFKNSKGELKRNWDRVGQEDGLTPWGEGGPSGRVWRSPSELPGKHYSGPAQSHPGQMINGPTGRPPVQPSSAFTTNSQALAWGPGLDSSFPSPTFSAIMWEGGGFGAGPAPGGSQPWSARKRGATRGRVSGVCAPGTQMLFKLPVPEGFGA